LQKYFKACLNFEKTYGNFAYVDTHGGSGRVLFEGRTILGSPLIAAQSEAKPECYAVEIDKERRLLLRKAITGLQNIKVIEGDCNKEISSLLKGIDSRKFTFIFLDPDGLVYMDSGTKVFQLTWQTITEISNRRNSEILVNLRSQDILRVIGAIDAEPERASALAEDIAALFGTDSWSAKLGSKPTRFKIRDLYLDRLQSIGFTHIGAVNIKSEEHSHMYYLIYASHHEIGAKIMNSNFKMEWGFNPLIEASLHRFIYDDIEHTEGTMQREIQTKLM